tara:strand:+ start:325 stop:819 length:495 start_codon:yes stop_codon:yes gene_type:complete
MAEKKKGFFEKIKDSLKIKQRGLRGANAELRRKRGRTLKSKTKMASFREDTKDNQRLQKETKDPTTKYTTYTKVSSKNKAKLSDQHKVKPKANSKSSNTSKKKKMHSIEKRNREIHGDTKIEALKEKHRKWKAKRKAQTPLERRNEKLLKKGLKIPKSKATQRK